MESPPKKQKWNLRPSDFSKESVHAAQDWRFQMFFEYLRISPSYALAMRCNSEEELAKELCDKALAQRVWKTRCDVGNVYEYLYREWWLANGLNLFGIPSARPSLNAVTRLSHAQPDDKRLEETIIKLTSYLNDEYRQQGQVDTLLVAIPLGLRRTTIMRQVRKLLDDALQAPVLSLKAPYELENNKMRYSRLFAGLRLIYMRAAKPDEELWRVATRAKISSTHNTLNPLGKKKDAQSAEARRMLTIMSSRLLRDSLIIAENAAQGIFPSLATTSVKDFDYLALRITIRDIYKWETIRKHQLNPSKTSI